MRLGVPHCAGIIGKRVRLPRGRATVKIVAAKDDAKARRPARTLFAAFERLAQGCSGRLGKSLLGKKIPSPACRFRVAEKVTGFVFSTYFGVRRQRRRFGFTGRSKAVSRYACRGTPSFVDCGAPHHPNDIVRRSTPQDLDL